MTKMRSLGDRAVLLVLVVVAPWTLGVACGAEYGGGSGTSDDPYLILTAEDMNEIGEDPNDWDKQFLLVGDIDLADHAGTQFSLIGSENTPFTGVFDGNGHTISNFRYSTTDIDSIGLFAYVDGPNAVICNLTLADPNIITQSGAVVGTVIGRFGQGLLQNCTVQNGFIQNEDGLTGGLCGHNAVGIISDCNVIGITISGDDYVGGICAVYTGGIFAPEGQIRNCSFSGTVAGIFNVGGICGLNSGRVSSCSAYGHIEGNENVGGTIGQHSGAHGIIEDCTSFCEVIGIRRVGGCVGYNATYSTAAEGIIVNSCSTGNVSGDTYVGGFTGYNTKRLEKCYAIGDVHGNYCVGGFCGYSDVTLKNCYARGDVYGGRFAGGLIGSSYTGAQFCYATGYVLGEEADSGGLYGSVQIAGRGYECFWDVETSGICCGSEGTGLNTAEMKSYNTYLKWECEDCWTIEEGLDYPHLVWENRPGTPIAKVYNYGGGSGTEGDPYLIYTADQLAMMQWYHRDLSKNFKLMANVDMSSYDGLNGRPAFSPIGSLLFPFTGVFDGNGLAISNLIIETNESEVGLFRRIGPRAPARDDFVHIRDLNLENAHIECPNDVVGALVGLLYRGTLLNCSVTDCFVKGRGKVGGMAGSVKGYVPRDGYIRGCTVTGHVSGDNTVGGIAGYSEGTIYQCLFQGSVTGRSTLGGICGGNEERIDSCGAEGIIGGSESRIGGVAGSSTGIVFYSRADCDVRGAGYVGGLIGNLYGAGTTAVRYCYSRGPVTGQGHPGGLVGNATKSDMYQCYATGLVTSGETAGGLVGRGSDASVVDCFWDVNSTGAETSLGGTAKTTEQMREAETYLRWECAGVWTIEDSRDYPRLFWENAPGTPIIPGNYGGGSGEPNDPYLIYSAEDLYELSNRECHWDKHVVLMSDIDMQYFDPNKGGREFTGIATGFSGTFDGNGHVISNLNSSIPLFLSILENGLVRNVRLENFSIHCEWPYDSVARTGALASHSDGYVEHCSIQGGTIEGVDYVGGLLGLNQGFVKNCFADVTVRSTRGEWSSAAGGLIGSLGLGEVLNCYALGSVYGELYSGGLIGHVGKAEVAMSYSTGSVSGPGEIGGLVGGTKEGRFRGCFWDMSTSGQTASAGGLGKTSAEMKMASTYEEAGWDFAGTREDGLHEAWMISDGQDYPVLSIFNGYVPPKLYGSGVVGDTYIISNDRELGATYYYPANAFYELSNDIDLSGVHWLVPPVPEFRGTLEGKGWAVSSIKITAHDRVGLFGSLSEGASISNLGVIDANIVGDSEVGLLAGYNYRGNIVSCYATGTISGVARLGGLVGLNYYGNISTSRASATIKGNSTLGGLAGRNYWGSITNSYAASNIVGEGSVAGFVSSWDGGDLQNCYAVGEVVGSSARGFAGWYGSSDSSCYFLDTMGTDYRATPLTDDQMKQQVSFVGWDFSTPVWVIDEGRDYPRLWWETIGPWSLEFVGFDVVDKTRIGRTTFRYALSIKLANLTHRDITDVHIKIVNESPQVTAVIDENIFIPVITRQAIVDSNACSDYFIIEVDRSHLIAPGSLTCEVVGVGQKMMRAGLNLSLPMNDCGAGFTDLAALAGQWLWTGTPGGIEEDSVPDGTVNLADFAQFAGNWKK